MIAPKWMVVDLGEPDERRTSRAAAGGLRRGDRRIRIETNLEIQWDRACIAAGHRADGLSVAAHPSGQGPLGIHVREVDAMSATLRLRGFPGDGQSSEVLESFAYRDFHVREPYRAVPGRFTRYGDVVELLAGVDDRLAIFGPGDEIALRFPVPVLRGASRSVILRSEGFCKDVDLYTAHPNGVEPLPFRAMRAYPYSRKEAEARAARMSSYEQEWNTRVVPPSFRVPVWETFEGDLPAHE